MIVYVVLYGDRHVDPAVEVFDRSVDAIASAWQFARANARHPDNIQEEESPWLLYLRYSNEGDFVRVEEVEVQS